MKILKRGQNDEKIDFFSSSLFFFSSFCFKIRFKVCPVFRWGKSVVQKANSLSGKTYLGEYERLVSSDKIGRDKKQQFIKKERGI